MFYFHDCQSFTFHAFRLLLGGIEPNRPVENVSIKSFDWDCIFSL